MYYFKKMSFVVSRLIHKNSRLDIILTKFISTVSRSYIKKMILLGYVSVNNVIIKIPKKKFF
ncbi:S4 domain-containing protein [Buchnera aphidicola]|uniref:S4 domain-containing protein n=1 Tax=Buchnera aphidicola TaxID=9 RepID=UPI001E2C356B|nr:S4 domain-containing protein [Buchnera aphidicola]